MMNRPDVYPKANQKWIAENGVEFEIVSSRKVWKKRGFWSEQVYEVLAVTFDPDFLFNEESPNGHLGGKKCFFVREEEWKFVEKFHKA